MSDEHDERLLSETLNRSNSLICIGDVFRFAGLRDATWESMKGGAGRSAQYLPGDEHDRHLEVTGISVTGSLNVRMTFPYDTAQEPSLHSVDYNLALAMIEQGIWQEVD